MAAMLQYRPYNVGEGPNENTPAVTLQNAGKHLVYFGKTHNGSANGILMQVILDGLKSYI